MHLGNVLIFLAIIGNSYYNVGCKKILERYTEMEMVFYTYVVMVILLTPLVLYYEPDVFARISSFTSQTWIGMGLLTFFHNFLSMILFFKALKVLDAMQVALSNYLDHILWSSYRSNMAWRNIIRANDCRRIACFSFYSYYNNS